MQDATHDMKFHIEPLRHASETRESLRTMIFPPGGGATCFLNVVNHGTCSLNASRYVSDVQMFTIFSDVQLDNLAPKSAAHLWPK